MFLFCFFQNDSVESLFVRDSTDHTSTTSQNYKIGLAGVRVLDFLICTSSIKLSPCHKIEPCEISLLKNQHVCVSRHGAHMKLAEG